MSRQSGSITRRTLLGGALAGPPAAYLSVAADPAAASESQFDTVTLRGTIDAAGEGLIANAVDDQSRILQAVLDSAALTGKTVFLPPGHYHVSNINLPEQTRLTGVPGATRLVYSGNGHFLLGENARHIALNGLTLDGQNRSINEYADALLRISQTALVQIEQCRVVGSAEAGIRVDRSSGRIERSTVSGALGLCGIYGLENTGFAIVDNIVTGCANGGILVHRWREGEDGTIIRGNRVSNIGAADGGTGQRPRGSL